MQKKIFDIYSIEYSTFVDFIKELDSKGRLVSTRNRKIACLKSFFKFLVRENILKKNPIKDFPLGKLSQKLPQILTSNEIELLLLQCDEKTEDGARNKAFLELLYGSGLRVSEACSLLTENVHDGFIKVIGKGSKQRIVPTTTSFKASLNTYWQNFKNHKKETLVFTTKQGKPITRTAFYNTLKKIVKDSKIKKRISPHTFRHTFATHLMQNGACIRVVQEILGHTSIATTGIYIHFCLKEIIYKFKKYHPRYFK